MAIIKFTRVVRLNNGHTVLVTEVVDEEQSLEDWLIDEYLRLKMLEPTRRERIHKRKKS